MENNLQQTSHVSARLFSKFCGKRSFASSWLQHVISNDTHISYSRKLRILASTQKFVGLSNFQ